MEDKLKELKKEEWLSMMSLMRVLVVTVMYRFLVIVGLVECDLIMWLCRVCIWLKRRCGW
jgi:hypothetical protein